MPKSGILPPRLTAKNQRWKLINRAAKVFAVRLNKLKKMHSDICEMILCQDKNHVRDGMELSLDIYSYIYESVSDLQKTFFAIAQKGYEQTKLKFDLEKVLNMELSDEEFALAIKAAAKLPC